MQKSIQENKNHRKIKPTAQISDSHCGPAVIEMLLGNLGIVVSQENIVKAAGAEQTLQKHGMRIDQLALAVHMLAPTVKFWHKDRANLDDLIKVLNTYDYPAGVEWWGIFEDSLEKEDINMDYGHYSIISNIDLEKEEIIIIDPYKDFVNQNRIIPIKLFLNRWWDKNEILDHETGEQHVVKDEQLFFILTNPEETFPNDLGMKEI